jgi:hypothetical protein
MACAGRRATTHMGNPDSVLNGLSDFSLSSWSFWLQLVGFTGILCIAASLLGSYFVHGQLVARANKKAADDSHVAALAGAQVAAAKTREETTQRRRFMFKE